MAETQDMHRENRGSSERFSPALSLNQPFARLLRLKIPEG